MRRLEIIHPQCTEEPLDLLADRIRGSVNPNCDLARFVTLYRRNGLGADVAVHIFHHDAPRADLSSSLGLHLASALRSFGLVKHTLWEELR